MKTNPNAKFEIEESMAKLLAPKHMEKLTKSNATVYAVENLMKAAEIFENLGMFPAAKAITDIMIRIK